MPPDTKLAIFDRACEIVGGALVDHFSVPGGDEAINTLIAMRCYQNASLALRNAARQGCIEVWGHKVTRHDGRGSPVESDTDPAKIPQVAWMHMDIEPATGIARAAIVDSSPELLLDAQPERINSEGKPCYVDLVFNEQQLVSLKSELPVLASLEPEGLSPEAKRQGTAAAESDCKNWLIEEMRKGPPTQNKPAYRKEAKQRFSDSDRSLSGRSFDHAWKNALAESGTLAWSNPGPKSKQ